MTDPIRNADAFMNLREVRAAIAKRGLASNARARLWLLKHGIAAIELSPRLHMYERTAVEAALAGAPVKAAVDPDFDPAQFMTLAAVCKLLGAGRAGPFDHRRALTWLAHNGVPVFRPTPKVALVPKASLARAIQKHTEVPSPPRRNPKQNLPPWVRSKAEQGAQAKATEAAQEARRNPGRKRVPKLKGQAAVAHKHELAAWGAEAREAERTGRTVPPLPEIDHSPPKAVAPRTTTTIVRPLNEQPHSGRRTVL